MARIPSITAGRLDGGYVVCRDGVRLGVIWRAAGGWVNAGYSGRIWRRSKPFSTAPKAAFARWGSRARDAINALARGTSKEAA